MANCFEKQNKTVFSKILVQHFNYSHNWFMICWFVKIINSVFVGTESTNVIRHCLHKKRCFFFFFSFLVLCCWLKFSGSLCKVLVGNEMCVQPFKLQHLNKWRRDKQQQQSIPPMIEPSCSSSSLSDLQL